MRLPSFVFLPVLALVLAGCQSGALKETSGDYLVIEHASLSRIAPGAEVSLQLYAGEQQVASESMQGFAALPYRYALSNGHATRAKVDIRFNGKTVMTGATELKLGAGGQLSLSSTGDTALQDTHWRALDISGRGIPSTIQTTLAFDNQGRLFGHSGCNHYRSPYRAAAIFLEVDAPRLTRKICADPLMYHENRYLQLLQKAERFAITPAGNLELYLRETDKPIVYEAVSPELVKLSLRSL